MMMANLIRQADLPRQKLWALSHPYAFALAITTFQLVLAVLVLAVAPAAFPGWDPIALRIVATCVIAVVAAGLLSYFQFWRESRFNMPSQWQQNWVGLLAALLWGVPLLFGTKALPASEAFTLTWGMIVNSFGEEALFRGLIMAALLPRGSVRAVLITSALFGSLHIMRLMFGAALGETLIQIAFAIVFGLLVGAVWLRTQTIWWPIIIHTCANLLPAFAADSIPQSTQTVVQIGSTAVALLLAIWLLSGARRDEGRLSVNQAGG